MVVVTLLLMFFSISGPEFFVQEGKKGPVSWAEFHALNFFILLLGGYAMTSVAFKELHHREGSYRWLTLPGSLLEKYISRLILTSIGYVLAATISYTLCAFIIDGLRWLIHNYRDISFNPFDERSLDFIGYFLVIHSLFLVGAVFFKQLAGLKTLLILSVFIMGGLYALDYYITGYGITYTQIMALKKIGRIAFWGVLAPAGWIAGYYLLRREEA